MKRKEIFYTVLVGIFFNSLSLNAQNFDPTQKGWVRLADILVDDYDYDYNHTEMEGLYFDSETTRWRINVDLKPSKFLWDNNFFTKIAVKNKHEGDKETKYIPFQELNLETYDLSPVDWRLEITKKKIKLIPINKKNKEIEIEKTDDGWTIYDLNKIVTVGECNLSFGPFTNLKPSSFKKDNSDKGESPEEFLEILKEKDLYNSIYVFLDSDLEDKLEERANIEKEKYKKDNYYNTPETFGLQLIGREQSSDGTIIEHYSNGIRFIKKTNGDYASFAEPKSEINEKNLEKVDGSKLPLKDDAKVLGGYRLTLPNNLILESNGIVTYVIFNEDNYLKFEYELSSYPVESIFKITYTDFIDPKNNLIQNSIKKESESLMGIPFDYICDGEEMDDNYYIKHGKNVTQNGTKFDVIDDMGYIYRFQPKVGLEKVGICWGIRQDDWNKKTFFVIEKTDDISEISKWIKKYNYVSRNNIVFENGDVIRFNDVDKLKNGTVLTMPDGSIMGLYDYNGGDKWKIKHPNGDLFVGNISNPISFYETYIQNTPSSLRCLADNLEWYEKGPRLGSGWLTTVNGEEI